MLIISPKTLLHDFSSAQSEQKEIDIICLNDFIEFVLILLIVIFVYYKCTNKYVIKKVKNFLFF